MWTFNPFRHSGSQLLCDFQIFFSCEWKMWEWLLSIDMKTKVVQHVQRVNERVQVCKSLQPCNLDMKSIIRHVDRLKEWESVRVFSPINSDFWAWTWKQKLFSMLRVTDCESDRVREWESDRVWVSDIELLTVSEWEIGRVWEWEWEWESVRVTVEHRDENKSWSACQEWVNERMKECESEKEWESDFWAQRWKQKLFSMSRVSEWESASFATFLVPSFCLTFRHFYCHWNLKALNP